MRFPDIKNSSFRAIRRFSGREITAGFEGGPESSRPAKDEARERERIRDYLGEIRNLRSKVLELDDGLQSLLAAGTIAGIFSVYLDGDGRAYDVLLAPTFGVGKILVGLFGLFLVLKVADYFLTVRAIDRLENLFVTFLYEPEKLEEKHLKQAEDGYKDARRFKIALTSLFLIGLVSLVLVVGFIFMK